MAIAGVTVLSQPAQANPGGTAVVINEAYLNGGSAGATYTHRYVELYNPTEAAVPLTGMSLQYRAATSTSTSTTTVALTGTIAAKGYWTLVGASNGANGAAVPGGDQTSSFGPSGSAGGTITLVAGTTAVDPSTSANVVDKLGYGTSNAPEGTAAPTGYNVTTGLGRNATSADTDNNSVDFTPQALTPDAVNAGGGGGGGTFTGTIAEIQGNGADATKNGFTATTTGVVTAKYATGGLNGFYMQTAGSGGATDPTPNASDAIFVFTGASGIAAAPAVGHTANVTGLVKEFNGLSEIDVTVAGASVADGGAATPIAPRTGVLPGTDCALPGATCLTGPALAAAQEAFEGELWQPSGDFTVTDAYDGSPFGGDAWGTSTDSNFRGEIGLAANSSTPLVVPTDVINAQDAALIDEREAYNKAHQLVLDDASSITHWNTSNTGSMDIAFPWFTPTNPVRVGEAVTFAEPVIYTDTFGTRRLQPTTQVTGDGSAQGVDFSNNRPTGAQDVGGDVKLATFNVLNFFPTSAAEFLALDAANTCTSFNDRDNNPIAVRACNPNGPRGAWDATNLARQRAKIVNAINALDADVVSLEELENSVHFGKDRDDAISKLVDALNADAGSTRWAYVPSPAAADLPPLAEQDVIRTGFIYDPSTVALVGASKVLTTDPAFGNAREPLAQAFKIKGTANADAFGVVVNHFKSKGSGTPDPDGQGNANVDRVAQANGLLAFADQFKADRSISRMFLVGDFNAYGEEDPVQELEQGADNVPGNGDDYTALKDTFDIGQTSYSFSGLSGSLDHIFANDAALGDVVGVDIVDINAAETVFGQYSRYNYNATILFDENTFYGASDHNPEVVGINGPGTVEVQILGTNDFHGRIANDSASAAAGAAVMAGAVKQLRAQNPNTVFAAAGDLIGASTFESFIDEDKPTIDALNSAGLEVSAAGNHEFDQGYDDLVNRVMAAYDPETNPKGGAQWQYIAANLRLRSTGLDALTPSWTKTMGGVKVGFVGAVTEHLPELVSPAGIADIEVEDIVTSVNEEADELESEGADVIVMLVHEGSGTTSCATMDDDPTSDFGSIIHGVNDNIDAIVSGHTHLEYNCSFPVAGWATENRPVTERAVVSAGQYGAALNQIVFSVDEATGEVQAKTQAVLKLKAANGGPFNYPVDQPTADIVKAAVDNAAVLGAQPLGELSAPFARAKFSDGTTANRGGESTLGNLVAEVQRWATRNPESGSAQIAFMNPGGLREDMVGGIAGETSYPKTLTYKQAANVQPFANTLVNMDLTGAQIKATLEQQWQPAGASRPFLRLGTSEGFEFTYDPSKPAGSRITGMWLHGTPIGLATTYSVTVNSFLAAGGDNFGALAGGTGKQDTGKTDLQAMVDYMAQFAATEPLPVDYSQHAVGVRFPADAPSSYFPGTTHVRFDLSSLVMTDPSDLRDAAVTVSLGGTSLGSFPVTMSLLPPADGNSNDEAGTASVDVVLPAGTPVGTATLVVTGATTGTSFSVPVTVADPPLATTVTGDAKPFKFGSAGKIAIRVSPSTADGSVEVRTATGVLLGTAIITGGKGALTLEPRSLPVGTHVLTLDYLGNSDFAPSQNTVEVKVTKGK
jgi:5'-nucleotidase